MVLLGAEKKKKKLGLNAVAEHQAGQTGGTGRMRLFFSLGEFCALYHFLGMGSGEVGVLIRPWDGGIHNQETKD